MAKVLFALPDRGFDPTEAAVAWRILNAAGMEFTFATETGRAAVCDTLTLMGPPIFAKILAAQPAGVRSFYQMEPTESFQSPITHDDIVPDDYDALILPGGHAAETKPYLESEVLQRCAAAFLDSNKVLGTSSHGALIAARSQRSDGSSILTGRTMTALTWTMEMSAWALTAWRLGTHYRIYPTPVQTTVATALGKAGTFQTGPLMPSYDSPFAVTDDNLVSARWAGDAVAWGEALVTAITARNGNGRLSAK